MTAVDRSLALALFTICLSMGITIFNDINTQASTGDRLFIDYEIDEFVNLNTLYVNSSQESLNSTTNMLGDYKKPEEVTQDFGFTHGIRIFNILVNTLINATFGLPNVLESFGIPSAFSIPVGILINLNYVFLMIYTILGKSY